MRKATALLLCVFAAVAASSKAKSDKVAIFVTGLDAAAPVAQALIEKLNASKPFEAVTAKDPSKVAVLISCMSPKQAGSVLACMYVAHYNGATFRTFLGAGLFFSTSADDVANNFLGSIAQDVAERYNDTDKDNLRQALESCLLLTDTKCNVPDPLQNEFNAKQLTLGQFLLKKNQ